MVFSKLDFRYHLIQIRKGDKWKTAFNTPLGHLEYLVRPHECPSCFPDLDQWCPPQHVQPFHLRIPGWYPHLLPEHGGTHPTRQACVAPATGEQAFRQGGEVWVLCGYCRLHHPAGPGLSRSSKGSGSGWVAHAHHSQTVTAVPWICQFLQTVHPRRQRSSCHPHATHLNCRPIFLDSGCRLCFCHTEETILC